MRAKRAIRKNMRPQLRISAMVISTLLTFGIAIPTAWALWSTSQQFSGATIGQGMVGISTYPNWANNQNSANATQSTATSQDRVLQVRFDKIEVDQGAVTSPNCADDVQGGITTTYCYRYFKVDLRADGNLGIGYEFAKPVLREASGADEGDSLMKKAVLSFARAGDLVSDDAGCANAGYTYSTLAATNGSSDTKITADKGTALPAVKAATHGWCVRFTLSDEKEPMENQAWVCGSGTGAETGSGTSQQFLCDQPTGAHPNVRPENGLWSNPVEYYIQPKPITTAGLGNQCLKVVHKVCRPGGDCTTPPPVTACE